MFQIVRLQRNQYKSEQCQSIRGIQRTQEDVRESQRQEL